MRYRSTNVCVLADKDNTLSQLQTKNLNQRRKQKGATLIVSLVLLSLITLFGLATMQSSNLQLKMTATTKERNLMLAASEAAISQAENELAASQPGYSRLSDVCGVGDECFENTCSGGNCFDGLFEASMKKSECTVAEEANATQRLNFWEDTSIWDDPGRHYDFALLDNIDNGPDFDVKYIIEFLCYVDAGGGGGLRVFGPGGDESLGAPLFRITTKAESESSKLRVMMQSTYVVIDS